MKKKTTTWPMALASALVVGLCLAGHWFAAFFFIVGVALGWFWTILAQHNNPDYYIRILESLKKYRKGLD